MNHKLNYTAEQIKGNTIAQLVQKGILPKKSYMTSEMPTMAYEFTLSHSSDYDQLMYKLCATPLQGSEKQVSWAEDLRKKAAEKIALVKTEITYYLEIGYYNHGDEEVVEIESRIEEFCAITSAKYLIDNRYFLDNFSL